MRLEHHRSPAWRIVAAVLIMLAVAGIVGLIAFFRHLDDLQRADSWASVLALLLAYSVATATLIIWVVRQSRATPPGDTTEPVEVRLRRAIRRQWAAEAGARQLEQPRPLRLRWRSTTRPVTMASSGVRQLTGSLVNDPATPRSPAAALVQAFASFPGRQLVILGEPGAGKTSLALLYTLATVGGPDCTDPVPVLLSAAGWQPPASPPVGPGAGDEPLPRSAGETLEEWLVSRLGDDYPGLVPPADQAPLWTLIADARIVPVLDGLDEMPMRLLPSALRDIDRAAAAGLRLVLTCRSAEFEAAVADAGALTRAAVVEIEPIRVPDAAVYLTQGELGGTDRWGAVIAAMRENPNGPPATALSTPLMISLARRVYRPPYTKPTELADMPTAASVRDYLLARFLPTVYPEPRAAARAERWLGFLAHHLRDRISDPNFFWWQLPGAVPRVRLSALVALFIIAGAFPFGLLMYQLFAPTTQWLQPMDLEIALLMFPFLICALGLFAGFHAGRDVHGKRPDPPGRRPWVKVLRNVGVVAGVAIGLGIATAVGVSMYLLAEFVWAEPSAVARAAGIRRSWPTIDDFSPGLSLLWSTTATALAVVALVTVTIRVGSGRGTGPRRSALGASSAWASLRAGLVVGLFFGFTTGAYDLLDGSASVLGAAGWAAVTGVPVALGRWLAAPVGDPAVYSPESLLRGDRRALLINVGAIGMPAATLAALLQDQSLDLVFLGVYNGIFAAVAVVAGSHSAWLSYSVARLWLAARGLLPWRLQRFLRLAYQAGVLRQNGPAYQFRHDLLREHLANRWKPQARARPAPFWTRRRQVVSSAIVSVLVLGLPAVAVLTETQIRPTTTLHGKEGVPLRPLALSPGGATVSAITIRSCERCPSGSMRSEEEWAVRQWHADGSPTSAPVTVEAGPKAATLSPPELSADGSTIVATDYSSSPTLWRVTLDGKTSSLPHPDGVFQTAVDAHGTRAAFTSPAGIFLWTFATNSVVRLTNSADGPLGFSPDGSVLAHSSIESVRLWNVADGSLVRTVPTSQGSSELALTKRGERLALLGLDDVVRVFDSPTGRHIATVPFTAGRIQDVAMDSQGTTLATADSDYYTVQLWDLNALIRSQQR